MEQGRSLTLGRRGFIAALLALAAAPAKSQSVAGAIDRLDAVEARRRALEGDLVLIDIRTEREWRASGLPDVAIGADMSAKDFGEKLLEATGGDRSKPIALICATGGRSGRVSRLLSKNGFTNVIDVSEGVLGSRAGPGWARRGLPMRQPEAPMITCCAEAEKTGG